MKNLLFVLVITLLIAGCDSKEKDQLKTQNDSLKVALEASQRVAETMSEVGTLMDSIDASRQLLRVNMVEGTTYADYTARMKDINGYVKDTQRKIDDLEKSLKGSNANSAAFSKAIKKLKAELSSKTTAIDSLQATVERYKNENSNLVSTVGMQEAEIADRNSQLETKQQELALIEARIQELMIQSKMSESDAYFARGQAIEEAANRTKLAPRKKKETYKEAIELYKKAQSLGNAQAEARITELDKKVK